MNVLLVGSGAREHALAWRLASSPGIKKLFCAPGNPGTEALAQNVAWPSDVREAALVASRLRIDLVVVGPEAPLVEGLADALAEQDILVFGPSRAAAELEGSKAFAKEIMRAAGVPTANAKVFTRGEDAEAFARRHGPLVVKADGLAAGKGVVVARTAEEAVQAVHALGKLGRAAQRLVLEDFLEGREVSLIALCDGERYALFPAAEDHKQIGDGDVGPNTGGMGAYAPVPFLSARATEQLGETVVAPVLAEMSRRGAPFRGALFAGLMLTLQGPRVLEFNCRFGDPETQPLMLLLDEDLLPLLVDCALGRLETKTLRVRPGAAVGVVLASAGYPGTPSTGAVISGVEPWRSPAQLFHAGTVRSHGQLLSAGGRVLTIAAQAPLLEEARSLAYAAAAQVHFEGMQLRRDIGARSTSP